MVDVEERKVDSANVGCWKKVDQVRMLRSYMLLTCSEVNALSQ